MYVYIYTYIYEYSSSIWQYHLLCMKLSGKRMESQKYIMFLENIYTFVTCSFHENSSIKVVSMEFVSYYFKKKKKGSKMKFKFHVFFPYRSQQRSVVLLTQKCEWIVNYKHSQWKCVNKERAWSSYVTQIHLSVANMSDPC